MNESPNVHEPLKPSRLMMKMVLISALIIIVIGAVYYRSLAVIPFALGVFVTSGLNILKLRMLERTVQKVMNTEDQEMGKNIVRLQYLLRYLLTGVVLVAVGLIHNYTSPPPIYSSRDWYIAIWAALFPNAPDALLYAPFISMWGALTGIFTLQLSVILVRSLKLEKDGEHFVKYVEDEDEKSDGENGENVEYSNENAESDDDNASNVTKEDNSE
jgi:hypothetical protein